MNFEALNDFLHSYFRQRGLQDADIDDVVQEALLKIHRARDSYDPSRSKLTTWAATIAQRCNIDRNRKRKPEPGLLEEVIGISSNRGEDAADIAFRLKLVMGKLPKKHRAILEQRCINGLPTSKLAESDGVKNSTIRWRLSQARQCFRELWKKYAETAQCQCGCGILIPKYTTRGKLRRFAHGHSRRVLANLRREITRQCACGCGTEISVIGKNGKTVRYVENHYNRENRKYTGSTRAKRMSQSALAKRKERRKAAKAAGIEVKKIVTKLCCACNMEQPTRFTGNYKADLTPIYHSRCIECKKEYQRARRKSTTPRINPGAYEKS